MRGDPMQLDPMQLDPMQLDPMQLDPMQLDSAELVSSELGVSQRSCGPPLSMRLRRSGGGAARRRRPRPGSRRLAPRRPRLAWATGLFALLACSVFASSPARADDAGGQDIERIREELRIMRERIEQLEAQLEARGASTRDVSARDASAADEAVAVEADAAPELAAPEPAAPVPAAPEVAVADEVPAPLEPDRRRAVRNALSSFISQTEFSGWIAGSYNYNFNGGDTEKMKGGNAGQFLGEDAGLYRFHPDANTFSLDQLWFEIDKAVSEDSRAGFHIDWLFGKTAENMGGGSRNGVFALGGLEDITFINESTGEVVDLRDLTISNSNDSGDETKLYTAYGSFLIPMFRGVRFDFGKIPSPVGAEVPQSPYNFNVSRGLLHSIQPLNHVGLLLSTELVPGFWMTAGVVNDFYTDTNVDLDSDKPFVGQLAYGNPIYSASASILYGSDSGNGSDDKVGLLDVLLTADPIDRLSVWLNADYQWFRGEGSGVRTEGENFGAAMAGRYEVTDWLGVSVRGEWLRSNPKRSKLGLASTGDTTLDLFAVTGTTDLSFGNAFTLRGELRYDWSDSNLILLDGLGGQYVVEDYYWKSNGGATDDQLVLLLEAILAF